MHLQLNIDIAGDALAGAAAGALATAGFIAAFTLFGVLAVNIMPFNGSSSDIFTAKYFRAAAIYITAGAIVGGLAAITGLPWWAAGLMVLALLVALHKATKYYHNRRRTKRGY
jgi:uncharacterized membrane protein